MQAQLFCNKIDDVWITLASVIFRPWCKVKTLLQQKERGHFENISKINFELIKLLSVFFLLSFHSIWQHQLHSYNCFFILFFFFNLHSFASLEYLANSVFGSPIIIWLHRAVIFIWNPAGAGSQKLAPGSVRENVPAKESHSIGYPPEDIHVGSKSQKNKVLPTEPSSVYFQGQSDTMKAHPSWLETELEEHAGKRLHDQCQLVGRIKNRIAWISD